MKKMTILAAIVALYLGSVIPMQAVAQQRTIDKVAVIVNNGVVLESEIKDTLTSVKQNARRSNQPLPDDQTLQEQIIERLIIDNLIIQIGEEAGITISDADVDAAIDNIAKQNKISVAQLQQYLKHEGMTFSTYRQQLRKEMLIGEVRNSEVRRRINILPQEVETLTQQMAEQADNQKEYNISHILISIPKNPKQFQVDKAIQKAESIVSQLNSGANFSKLAATYSSDPQAFRGGNMGWSTLPELPDIFASLIANANKNDIIGPIRSGVGFHILKVNDLRKKNAPTVTETEYHTRHILIKPSVLTSDQQVIQQLNDFVKQIKQGSASFADLAKEYSQDPGSAALGGDLSWSIVDIFDPAFAKAIKSLKKGQISTPIRSSFGWHIIELLDSRNIDGTETAMRQQAYRLIFNRKFSEEVQTWMQEQRAAAYVKVLANNQQ